MTLIFVIKTENSVSVSNSNETVFYDVVLKLSQILFLKMLISKINYVYFNSILPLDFYF